MERNSQLWYYTYDGHGNVRTLTNEYGNVTDYYAYDASGNLLKKSGGTENDFLYTGEQYNATTGLYYLRARYMDPSTGTFISMDSYQGSLYDPVSLHKYLYANANPVKYTDPTGYFSLADCSMTQAIQSNLQTIHNIKSLQNIMKWADAMTTAYDVGTELKDAILADGSVIDVIFAMLKGVVIGFMIDGMCKTPLRIILKPMMAIFGLGDQVDQIQEAIESGNPAEIAVRFVQLICMLFGLTSQCFTGDTLVSTEDGLRPIEEIQVGDYVWAEDTETGKVELKKVLAVSVTESDTLVHVTTEDGTKIDTTENHPFYVEDKGWTAAAELEVGDVLHTQDGEIETVSEVEVEILEEAVKVYNLEVEDSHTYYVSMDRVLVHNGCGSSGESGTDSVKRINVGDSGHHVPAVRKSKERPFAVSRSDKTRPTLFLKGGDPGYDHWRLHGAERNFVGPRQGDFIGTNDELFDAYRNAYRGIEDIKVDVKSPNGTYILGTDVTPYEAVGLVQTWLKEQGLY